MGNIRKKEARVRWRVLYIDQFDVRWRFVDGELQIEHRGQYEIPYQKSSSELREKAIERIRAKGAM